MVRNTRKGQRPSLPAGTGKTGKSVTRCFWRQTQAVSELASVTRDVRLTVDGRGRYSTGAGPLHWRSARVLHSGSRTFGSHRCLGAAPAGSPDEQAGRGL